MIPSSPQDESLLLEVVRFINYVLKLTPSVPKEMREWLNQRLYDRSGPLLGLLGHAASVVGEKEEGGRASDTRR